MKCSAAFLALAITLAATAEAAPAPGKFGSFFGGGKTGSPSTSTSATGGSSSIFGAYNKEGGASALNAGLGTGAGALALGAGAITAETNNEKDDQAQQQPAPQRRVNTRPSSTRTGSTASDDSFVTAPGSAGNTRPPSVAGSNPVTANAGTQTGADAAKGASWGDRIGSGNQALGLAAGGLAVWNANEGLQQQQDSQQQQRRSALDRRLNPAVAAEGAMMVAPMMMGGGGSIGPSFGNSHTDASGQKSGNSNVRVGSSSGNMKRSDAAPLDRRLGFSFSNTNEDGSLQQSGNSNVRVGASSGGADPGRTAILQALSQGGGSGAATQKQQKRLVSVSNSKTDQSGQASGNYNTRIGASSGNISPQVYAMLNPGTTF